jgi:hypothetical protein
MMPLIEVDFWEELAQIQAESIGWIPFDKGAYLHLGSDESSDTTVIAVVGLPNQSCKAEAFFGCSKVETLPPRKLLIFLRQSLKRNTVRT